MSSLHNVHESEGLHAHLLQGNRSCWLFTHHDPIPPSVRASAESRPLNSAFAGLLGVRPFEVPDRFKTHQFAHRSEIVSLRIGANGASLSQ